jgi:hypothetical protein
VIADTFHLKGFTDSVSVYRKRAASVTSFSRVFT